MVQFSEQIHRFDAPLLSIALAHNLRFPSPYSTHVLSSDVISRSFSPPSTLRTTRLILKRGKLPAWAPRGLVERGTSWVLEESEVDLEQWRGGEGEGEVRTRSRNIDHKTVMEVSEWQAYRSVKGDALATEAITLTRVGSQFSFWPLQRRIEKFGISRVPKSSEKARAGLALATSLLLSPATAAQFLASGPLNLFPFEPLPSSLAIASEAVRNKLNEARLSAKEKERKRLESGEELLWRSRWSATARKGVKNFRARVCALTGFLCTEKDDC